MMIAIVRKNLACLISKHNSFVCKSLVSSRHFYSTSQNVTCPWFYDLLLHKHHFSAELASLVASDLGPPKSPENADSILSFLKESGCSTTQLEKIVKYNPRILSRSVDDIKLKIKLFQDLGLSPEEIAKMISSNLVILHLSAKSNIIPSLSVLKGFLGSDYDVARLVRKSTWCITVDLEKSLLPNVELLKSFGIPMERILFMLYLDPRFLLIKPDVMRKSAEKAREMGFNESSKMFVHALRSITGMRKEWEAKLQSFQEMGFSESDSLTMFNKDPSVVNKSMEKMEKVKELLLATGKYNMHSIVNFPQVFGYNIEQRIEPRLRILKILESKNLIKKWPCVGSICAPSEDKFFKRFVRPYLNEEGKAFVTKSCVKEKILDKTLGIFLGKSRK